MVIQMDSLDKYARRVRLTGRSTVEASIKESIRVMEELFHTSPSFYEVKIDEETVDTIINKTNNYDVKLIHFRKSYKPVVGSIISFKDDKYLLMEKDEDEVYSFGKMEKCNYLIKIQTSEEKIVIGYDERNRPIYDTVANYKDEPCILRDKYYSSNDNTQLPLPEGKLEIYIKHQKALNIKINEDISIHDKIYKISDISYIEVIDGEGVTKIYAERREDADE